MKTYDPRKLLLPNVLLFGFWIVSTITVIDFLLLLYVDIPT